MRIRYRKAWMAWSWSKHKVLVVGFWLSEDGGVAALGNFFPSNRQPTTGN